MKLSHMALCPETDLDDVLEVLCFRAYFCAKWRSQCFRTYICQMEESGNEHWRPQVPHMRRKAVESAKMEERAGERKGHCGEWWRGLELGREGGREGWSERCVRARVLVGRKNALPKTSGFTQAAPVPQSSPRALPNRSLFAQCSPNRPSPDHCGPRGGDKLSGGGVVRALRRLQARNGPGGGRLGERWSTLKRPI